MSLQVLFHLLFKTSMKRAVTGLGLLILYIFYIYFIFILQLLFHFGYYLAYKM